MKKRNIFLCLLIVVIAYGFFYGWNHKLFVKVSDEDKITSVVELEKRINEELNEGTEEFTVYIKDLELDEIKNINEQLDGFFGYVSTYRMNGETFDKLRKTTFNLEISDNFYVYDHYKNGTDIEHRNDKVVQLAKQCEDILEELIKDDMSDYEKLLTVHDYIIANAEYGFLKDDLESYSYRAYGVLVENKGVCNSYAEAMQLMAMMMDIESLIVTGDAGGVNHAWNLVNLDDEWYHIDTTWNDPLPDEAGRVLHTYFNVTDEMLMQSHTWNMENYPSATASTYNYYKVEDLYCRDYGEFRAKVLELMKDTPKEIDLLVEDYNKKTYDYDFIFREGSVNNLEWRSYGEVPCTTLVLNLNYN